MKTVIALCLAALFAGPANAGDPPDANSLANVLGSEDACHLSYDQGAVERYVQHYTDQNGPALDLGLLVEGNRVVVQGMDPRTRTLHCIQVRAAAKLYGFIK